MLRICLIILAACNCNSQCLEISGRWVTANDLSSIVPEFRKLDAGTQLIPAPWFHSRRVLSNRELVRLAMQHNFEVHDVPGEVCLEARSVIVTHSTVQNAIEQALAAVRGDAIVEATIIDFNPKKAPVGTLLLGHAGLMSACSAGPCSSYRWRGAIQTADGQSIPFKVELRLEVMETMVIAKRAFSFGEKVSPHGYVSAERRVAWHSGPKREMVNPVGQIVRRAIKEGEIISRENLRRARDVESGESIELEVRSGELVLVTQAHAVTGGKQGDRVIVRNSSTKKNFAAVVTGPAKARTIAPVGQGDLK